MPRLLLSLFLWSSLFSAALAAESKPLQVLFLGDQGHHLPAERFKQLAPVLADRGIELTYTEDPNALNPETLGRYQALVVYANIDRIEPRQEKALLDYVEKGGGFVPLHCASFCFRNSDKVVALIGAQFQRHETGVFRTEIVAPEHPLMRGFGGFESWDETYVHTKHNEKDRTVLEVRVEGEHREPWTWVRTQGRGRVFYTAWGHDHRTFSKPGFQNLVERGILWAAGRNPADAGNYLDDQPFPLPRMTPLPSDEGVFTYTDVGKQIPNYTPSKQWGVQGEPFSKMQDPLEPAKSQTRISVPEGFHVELFASEPLIEGKPITMAWDEKGRLWIAETYDYPNELQPEGKGRDRIRVLEDTDGDGRADKSTVFAEHLSIPTSLAFHRGGLIVQDGRETVYLKDTDGDDKADERKVLFTGWALGDTHGGVSNFQYGLDNWVWAMQGYNDSHPVVNGQEQQGFRQGFFRFRPDGSQLEFLRSTNNNTWGLGISEEGLILGSTANRCPSVYMPIPNRYYESVRGWTPSLVLDMISDTYLFKAITDKVRQVDQHGGYTAAAGSALYTARAYPREYWNRVAFVTEPTGHIVGGFVLQRDGADFRSKNSFNLLGSDDEWCAPIMAEVGPDGNVWVLDWYNYIVQHNPTPNGFQTGRGNAYESGLRDKKHGRVYRVVYDAETKQRPLDLSEASPEALVATLSHPTQLWRKHAQRLIVERGQQDVVPGLLKLAADPKVDEIGLNVGAIHALWTLHGLGALDGANPQATAAAVAALRHKSAGVRRNALQVLPREPSSTAAVLEAGLLQDVDAQVRLAAALALADLPASPAAGAAVAAALADPANAGDRWIPDALTSAAAHDSASFLPAVAQAKQPRAKQIEVAGIVAGHYARSGAADGLAALVKSLTAADAKLAEAVVRGLVDGWPADAKPALNEALEADLNQLSARLSPGARGGLVKLATRWGSTRFGQQAAEITAALVATIEDDSKSDDQRIAAATELVAFQADEATPVEQVLDQVTPRTSPALAAGLLQALSGSTSSEAGGKIVERLRGMTPAARTAAIAVLLGRAEWTREMMAGIDRGDLQLADLALDQKQALAAHPDRQLRRQARELLERGGALPSADRQKVLDELLPLTHAAGDAAAGKLVFTKHCATCHTHSGEGRRIGPDLTGMAVHPKEELLTNIIDPSRSVEGNFRVYTVVTEEGQVLTGLLASESRTAIEIVDAEGNKKSLLRDDVAQLVATPKSLMPEGFEKQVSPEELTNLLEFLTQRGQYLPLDLTKAATITSVRGMFYNRENEVERLMFGDWGPKVFRGVPFVLVDPQGGRAANVIMLHGPQGALPPGMPRSVSLPVNSPAAAIHLLGGVSGWGFPYGREPTTSLIVRLHYHDGQTEDHELKNGEHLADYIRRVDVPGSEFAFDLGGRQLRYLSVQPQRTEPIERLELVKGDDVTAPVVMAITVETRK
ncbi:MAG: PVC-type heme-binding CxxCH protein [Pirellulales bacterium]